VQRQFSEHWLKDGPPRTGADALKEIESLQQLLRQTSLELREERKRASHRVDLIGVLIAIIAIGVTMHYYNSLMLGILIGAPVVGGVRYLLGER
jgi:hypothetical protein